MLVILMKTMKTIFNMIWGEKMTEEQEKFCERYDLSEDQFFGKEKIKGDLDLRSLVSIPSGFNPTVGGYLDLRSLVSIPSGFNPTVGGGLWLPSLESIPSGFNPTVGGDLDLSSLESIPSGFNPTVGGDLYIHPELVTNKLKKKCKISEIGTNLNNPIKKR